jgi:hypothetical protein
MSFDEYDTYDETPEEVPNWYLFQQNRSIQQRQGLITALVGANFAFLGLLLVGISSSGYIISLLGLAIAYLSMLKVAARDPDSWARAVCNRLGFGSWVDAETVIAERESQREALADGGEEQ